MTRAELQAAIDAGGEVLLPIGASITVDTPLILGSNVTIRGQGATLVSPARAPIFEATTKTAPNQFAVYDLTLRGGGIRFPSPPEPYRAPGWFRLENIWIWKAPIAFDDRWSASWMGTLKRIWARECDAAFVKHAGTTIHFENCFSAGSPPGGMAWNIVGVYGCVLTACGMDLHTATPLYPAAAFADCHGLTINGWDSEHNVSQGGPVFLFQRCDALSVCGFWTIATELRAPAGKAAYLMQIDECVGAFAGVSLGGGTRPPESRDFASGDPTGHTAVMILTGRNRIALSGCTIQPAERKGDARAQTAFGFVDTADPSHRIDAGNNVGANLPPEPSGK